MLKEVLGYATVAPGHEALWGFVRIVGVRLGREVWEGVLNEGGGEGGECGEGVGEERKWDKRLRERSVAWVGKWGESEE